MVKTLLKREMNDGEGNDMEKVGITAKEYFKAVQFGTYNPKWHGRFMYQVYIEEDERGSKRAVAERKLKLRWRALAAIKELGSLILGVLISPLVALVVLLAFPLSIIDPDKLRGEWELQFRHREDSPSSFEQDEYNALCGYIKKH